MAAAREYGINAHAAMPADLMQDIRLRALQSVQNRSRETLTDLDSDRRPNLINAAAKRSGSFVKQRQESLLRKSSLSSSQSSLNSLSSDRGSSFGVAGSEADSPRQPPATSNGLSRTSSINLPRIPSKTLKDRGLVSVSAATSRNGDVSKRNGAENGEDRSAAAKMRRLNSSGSSAGQSESWASSPPSSLERNGKVSEPDSPRSAEPSEDVAFNEVVMRRKVGTVQQPPNRPLQRQERLQSDGSATPRNSAPSSRASSRPTSGASDYNRFRTAISRKDSGPVAASSRPGSGSSSRTTSELDKSTMGGREVIVTNRLSFDAMMGSSTPRHQQHPVASPQTSSSSSLPPSPPPPATDDAAYFSSLERKLLLLPPPPPFPVEESQNVTRKVSLPPPPPPLQLISPHSSVESKTSLPLPSPPPSPPASPLAAKAEAKRKSPLFQPRPPSHLSAEPLPTPPPTPNSSSFEIPVMNFDLAAASTTQPGPSTAPSSSVSLSHKSSPRRSDAGSELDFLSFLPDELPLGYTEDGRKRLNLQTNVAAFTNGEGHESRAGEVAESWKTEDNSIDFALDVGKTERETTAAPVIHFPPPPTYSPSRSPTLQASRTSSGTSPMSPGASASGRATSTSTEAALGFLEQTLDPYSPHSLSTTPNLLLSPFTPNDVKPSSSTRSSAKTEEVTAVIGPLQLPRKPSQEKKKRKTSTETTKYEGSVKTVRRQIRPGHVGDLREIFKKEESSELDEDDECRRQRRERRKARKEGREGEDSDGSGYTTTSSDNEYDLLLAEQQHGLDLSSSSSLFSTPRDHSNYELNWEIADGGTHSPKSASSVESSSAQRKTSGLQKSVFSFESEETKPPQKESLWKFERGWRKSSVGKEEKEQAIQGATADDNAIPNVKGEQQKSFVVKVETPAGATHSIAHPVTANNDLASPLEKTGLPSVHSPNNDDFVASLPSLGLALTDSKPSLALNKHYDSGKKEVKGQLADRTSVASSVSTISHTRTRSSSSDSDASSGEARQAKTAGSVRRNSNPGLGLSLNGPSTHGATDSPLMLVDGRKTVSAASPGLKVRGRSGGGGEIISNIQTKGESRLASEAEIAHADPTNLGGTPISLPTSPPGQSTLGWLSGGKDKNKGDGEGEEKRPKTASHYESDSLVSIATYSSMTSRPPVTDTSRTGSERGGEGLAQKLAGESLVTSPAPSGKAASLRMTTESAEKPSASSPVTVSENHNTVEPERPSSGTADILSILSDISLDRGTSFSTQTAERARQLYAVEDSGKKRSFENSTSNISVAAGAETIKSKVHESGANDKEAVPTDSSTVFVAQSSVALKTTKDEDSLQNGKDEINKDGSSSDSDSKEEDSDSDGSGDEARKMPAAVGQRASFTIKRQTSGSSTQQASSASSSRQTSSASSSRKEATLASSSRQASLASSSRQASAEVGMEEQHVDTKMSAAVGSKSSFTIKRGAGSSSSSSNESEPAKAHYSQQSATTNYNHKSSKTGGGAGDMYVYKDLKGDVYVMQDVTDSSKATTLTAPTTAVFRSANDESVTTSGMASFHFQGLSSSDSILVDTDSVDISKASEVIGAFMTRDLANRRNRENPKGESVVKIKGVQPQHELLRSLEQHNQHSLSRTSEFEVVAGNVGVRGPQQPPDFYNHHQQQRQSEEVNVLAASTAEVGERSEVRVNIPRNAVPVLPIPKTRAGSVTSSKITPMVYDPALSPTYVSTYKHPVQTHHDLENHSSVRRHEGMENHSNIRRQEDLENHSSVRRQEDMENHSSVRRQEDLENHSSVRRQEDYTYSSKAVVDGNRSIDNNADQARRSSKPEVGGIMRKDSSSSDSSEDGRTTKYRVGNLKREESYRQAQVKADVYTAEETASSAATATAQSRYGQDRVYDSGLAYAPKQPQRGAVASHVNSSFDNDSQYGSQTSRATSGNEPSSPDEHLYRVLRHKDTASAAAAAASASPQSSPTFANLRFSAYQSPPTYQQSVYQASDHSSHTARDYERRDSWSADRYFRSEPEPRVPYYLNRSFTTLPHSREEEEGMRGQFKVTRTGYSGLGSKVKVGSRTGSVSSDSESDSGVEGGRMYRTVSRVTEAGADIRRSSSLGSLNRAAQLSLPPRSPSPPSTGQQYRVSALHREQSWGRSRHRHLPSHDLFSLSRVTSDGHLPRDFAHDFSKWMSDGGAEAHKRRSWAFRQEDASNNSGPLKGLHSFPPQSPTSVYQREVGGVLSRDPGHSSHRSSGSFRSNESAMSRGELHRSEINLSVNQGRLTRSDSERGDGKQYRVLNVKPSSQETGSQSFSSPVSGYESDLELMHATDTMYAVRSTQSHDQRRDAPFFHDDAPAFPVEKDNSYIVSGTRPTATFGEEERVTLREVKPRETSQVNHRQSIPGVTRSSSGQWHKTTIDIKRSGSVSSSGSASTAPVHSQQSKSYVVFNGTDNLRGASSREVSDSRTSLMQRSSSPPVDSGDRIYRVMSPVPSDLTQRNPLLNEARHTSSGAFQAFSADHQDVPDFAREMFEERNYQAVSASSAGILPEASLLTTEEEKDLRVLRGKILIQNRMDDSRDQDDFLDNMNVFDNSFHLGKDNPLYQSDPDLYKTFEEAVRKEEMRSREIGREVTQDITWETVDRMAKQHQEGVRQSPKVPKRKKQNLSTMLLTKLASIDSGDIHQTIDVKHHHEEIYGDVALVHADGSRARNAGTANFDSVHENVELELKQGKAFIIIKVIAERIIPIDYEFNVWRKSQAIVTRNIEIDLCTNEQRRRLYERVMETGGRMPGALEGGAAYGAYSSLDAEDERQLSSLETLRLFSQLLDVSEGRGDVEDLEMRTRHEMGSLTSPSGLTEVSSPMDLLY